MSLSYANIGVFLKLVERMNTIYDNEFWSWKTRYDLIFHKDISGAITTLDVELDYFDPDISFKDDLTAYVGAVREYAKQLRHDHLQD